jgi:hypothetical protein
MKEQAKISRRFFMGAIPGAGMAASKIGQHLPSLVNTRPAYPTPGGYIGTGLDGRSECPKDIGVAVDYYIERAKQQAMRLASGRDKKNLTPDQKREIETMRLHNMQSANRLKSVSPAYANLMFLDEAERQFLKREEYYATKELEEIKKQAGIFGFLISDNLLGDDA